MLLPRIAILRVSWLDLCGITMTLNPLGSNMRSKLRQAYLIARQRQLNKVPLERCIEIVQELFGLTYREGLVIKVAMKGKAVCLNQRSLSVK
jgi:hypothetical protein